MKFESLTIRDAVLIRPEPATDHRGAFARVFCEREFEGAGLPHRVVQSSVSFNSRRGTVRGMHFQWPPSREGKVIRCSRGAMIDVLLDLRPDSPSYLQHAVVPIDNDGRHSVFVPNGVAHGFQTLMDSTEVVYCMTDFFCPQLAAGFRWNDPAFGIAWPITDGVVISERDARYPDFERHAYEAELERRRR